MSKPIAAPADGYRTAVAMALDHFDDPAWLGTNSPLAAPYYLGPMLHAAERAESATERGRALCRALTGAAQQLSPGDQQLLRSAVFERRKERNNVGVAQELGLPPRTFYRNKNAAIQKLAEVLNRTIHPALRPESPVRPPMVGRTEIASETLDLLSAGKSVYISGAGGTGKTTLGSAIVEEWNDVAARDYRESGERTGPANAFWFTVRRGFNDYLTSFLFTLGYFLRNLGAPNIWRQLVADQGKIRTEHLLGLMRHDLEMFSSQKLLICIDEIDELQPERSEHAQLFHWIEELRNLLPTLLIGQRIVLEASEYYALSGFDEAEARLFLVQRGLHSVSAEIRQQLIEKTRGNPGLMTLLVTLHEMGVGIEETLLGFEDAPSMEALFMRVWRRLTKEERAILTYLSVFRGAAPADAWREERKALDQLAQRGLLQLDSRGGVYLQPYIHRFALERSSVEVREILHLQAATARESRGEITEAMYHFISAGSAASAIWLWSANSRGQIDQGHGPAALDLLASIPGRQLSAEKDRQALHQVRAALYILRGRAEEAAQELEQIDATRPGEFSAYVEQLRGSVAEMQGQAHRAVEHYRTGLDRLTGSHPLREVTLHTRLGFLQEFHLGDREAARRQAILARVKAEGFHGNIEEMAGRFDAARERYQAAFDLAYSLEKENLGALSRAYSQLGVLSIKLGQYEEAIPLIESAIQCDSKLGDIGSPLYDQLNLSYAHAQLKRFDRAKDIALEALEMANKIGNRYLVAGLAAGVGEAALGLGELATAEAYARRSLEEEEGYFRCAALTLIGQIYGERGAYEEAENYLGQAIESAQEFEDPLSEADALEKLATVQVASGFGTAAKDSLDRALQIYRKVTLGHRVEAVQKRLAELSESHV